MADVLDKGSANAAAPGSTTLIPDEIVRLWPHGAPGPLDGVGPEIQCRTPLGVAGNTLILRNISEPTLSLFRPAKPNGVGVIVCPGGGWRLLLWEHEGAEIVRWLTAHGYTAMLLKYRVRGTPASQAEFDAEMEALGAQIERIRQGPQPRAMNDLATDPSAIVARRAAAEDGLRAIRIAHERAQAWGIDPAKIGMVGFSVGGCLTIDAAIGSGAAGLAFVAPIYGGDTGRPLPADLPPLFTVIGQDDFLLRRVVEGLYADWTEAGGEAEMHVYRRGGHGFGLVKQGFPSDRWSEAFLAWLADLGFA